MPSIILKTSPTSNRYVLWDTVSNRPVFVGDRAAVTAEPFVDADRLARADATGTSSKKGVGSFVDSHLAVGTLVSAPGRTGRLPRELLAEYVDLILDDDQFGAETAYVRLAETTAPAA